MNPKEDLPKLLKALSGGATVAGGMLPKKWANPVIEFQDTAEIARLMMSVLSHPEIPSRFVPQRRTQVTLTHTAGGIALRDNAGHDQIKLNETSALIWELCTGEHACGQMIAMLEEHYPDAEETIARNIQRAIVSFHEGGLLDIFDPAGQSRKTFDEDWKCWIRHNAERGCDKDEIFKILIDNGFDYDAIRNELKHEPSVSINQIENPLRTGIDPLVAEIDARICRYIGINPSYSEVMQGQYYEIGEEFKPHTDYFDGLPTVLEKMDIPRPAWAELKAGGP